MATATILSYSGTGDFLATNTALFTDKSKVYYNIGKLQTGGLESLVYWNDSDSLGITTGGYDGVSPTNGLLNYTSFEFVVYP